MTCLVKVSVLHETPGQSCRVMSSPFPQNPTTRLMVQQMHHGTGFDDVMFKSSKTLAFVTGQTKSCTKFALVISMIYYIGYICEYNTYVCKAAQTNDLVVRLESCVLPSFQSLWIVA